MTSGNGAGAHPGRDAAAALAAARYTDRMARRPRSFLSIEQLSPAELQSLIDDAIVAKAQPEAWAGALAGQAVALLFQKTSTRTRCSFEIAAADLGAHASYIDWQTSNFVLADLRDEVRVLSRYYQLIVARVMRHATLDIMAAETEVPVINGLCDRMHPCQALTDYMTMTEYFGALGGLHLTYLGDANNVCTSLMQGAIKLGVHMRICSPPTHGPDPALVAGSGGLIEVVAEPADAVRGADVIYTDTWVSMGQEQEQAARLRVFAPYQVNSALLASAPASALIMHCLPAHPGREITAECLRAPRSLVFDQAENRKHAQKVLMRWLAEINTAAT